MNDLNIPILPLYCIVLVLKYAFKTYKISLVKTRGNNDSDKNHPDPQHRFAAPA
jgi:hypothetical protein